MGDVICFPKRNSRYWRAYDDVDEHRWYYEGDLKLALNYTKKAIEGPREIGRWDPCLLALEKALRDMHRPRLAQQALPLALQLDLFDDWLDLLEDE